jgi:hypothetical protein
LLVSGDKRVIAVDPNRILAWSGKGVGEGEGDGSCGEGEGAALAECTDDTDLFGRKRIRLE